MEAKSNILPLLLTLGELILLSRSNNSPSPVPAAYVVMMRVITSSSTSPSHPHSDLQQSTSSLASPRVSAKQRLSDPIRKEVLVVNSLAIVQEPVHVPHAAVDLVESFACTKPIELRLVLVSIIYRRGSVLLQRRRVF